MAILGQTDHEKKTTSSWLNPNITTNYALNKQNSRNSSHLNDDHEEYYHLSDLETTQGSDSGSDFDLSLEFGSGRRSQV